MEKQFYWSGTVCAPNEYPMEVYDGAIIADNYVYNFDAIWGTQNTGWGNSGGDMASSNKDMHIPHSLEFTWLSHREKKMYTGKWKLDIQKITQLFEEGYMDYITKKRETYNEIKIGLGPKGRVAVWINGLGYQKEVGFYQAHDTIIAPKDVYENAQYMFKPGYSDFRLNSDFLFTKEIKEKIAKFGIPEPDSYVNYRKTKRWKPVLKTPENGNLCVLSIDFLNGESIDFWGVGLNKIDYSERPKLNKLSILWLDESNNENGIQLKEFDDNEFTNAFEQFDPKDDVDLVVKTTPDNSSATVFLKSKTKEIQLKKVNIHTN